MKKIITLYLIILSVNTFAQKTTTVSTPRKNALKVDPVGYIIPQSGLLSFERAVNAKQAFVVKASYVSYNLSGYKYTGTYGGAEYRFYFGKDAVALKGFHAGPAISYGAGKVKESGSVSPFTSIAALFIGGKQWVWQSGFLINLHLGAGYSNFKYKDNNNSIFSGLKGGGLALDGGIGIGYSF